MNLEYIKDGETVEVKLRAGRFLVPAKLKREKDRIFAFFPYNKILLDEVRNFFGRKYHGFDDDNPRKVWSFPINQHNQFKNDLLAGENPYEPYDSDLIDHPPHRDCLMGHQRDMLNAMLTRRHVIIAGEMGTGKTLAAIEAMEHLSPKLGIHEAWYVGPVSGVKAVGRELKKWKSKVIPRMMTYNKLVQVVRNWEPGKPAPRAVIFDESSRIKTPSSQRSQAAKHLADAMREEYGRDCLIIEMSGSPSPKQPTDWFHQAEVACPGFLKEGNIHTFKQNLCIIEEREGLTGKYPHIVAWLDSEDLCGKCGRYEFEHDKTFDHAFVRAKNEVARLYKRLAGLVHVYWKKDCTDLPDKIYDVIKVKPTVQMLRSAQMIKAKTSRAAQAFNLLRELSDGFQYEDVDLGETKTCSECGGSGEMEFPVYDSEHYFEDGVTDVEFVKGACTCCGGAGEVTVYERQATEVGSPKDEILKDLLEEHEDVGRLVVWGGFTGSIDRITKLAQNEGWAVLRVDGRGYHGFDTDGSVLDSDELLSCLDRSDSAYDELINKHPKVCFVGQPQAGGMALTLTASPTAVYYSNSFSGEGRIQSEDRIHRLGMDKNRGARIVDLICLPSDQIALENLRQKRRLQDMTMGELNDAWDASLKEIQDARS